MAFHQIEQDTSFYGLTRLLINSMKKNHEGEYLLFNREEAKKLHYILDNVWYGLAHVSVSFYYKGDDVVAFKTCKTNAYDKLFAPMHFLNEHKERLDSLFAETTEITEEDKDFIRNLFYMKKAA